MVEPRHAAFYHAIRKQIFTGTILGRENVPVNCVDGLKGVNMFKLSYFDGKQNLVAFVSPKNVIAFEP